MAEKKTAKKPRIMPIRTTSKSMSKDMIRSRPTQGDSVVVWSSNSAGYIPKKEKNDEPRND